MKTPAISIFAMPICRASPRSLEVERQSLLRTWIRLQIAFQDASGTLDEVDGLVNAFVSSLGNGVIVFATIDVSKTAVGGARNMCPNSRDEFEASIGRTCIYGQVKTKGIKARQFSQQFAHQAEPAFHHVSLYGRS